MGKEREPKYIIKLGFSEWRKRKGIKKQKEPIKRSEYAQRLFEIGAGFNGDEFK